MQVQHYVQTFNGGNTQTTNYTITVNEAGNVTASSVVTTYGTIAQAQAGGAPQALQLPDDYNRETTQLAIKDKLADIKTKQEEIATELKGGDLQPPTPIDYEAKYQDQKQGIEDKLNEVPQQYEAAKGNWFSWVWTPPIGTCEMPAASLKHGGSVNWDICPITNKIKDAVGFLWGLTGAWYVYTTMFRSQE